MILVTGATGHLDKKMVNAARKAASRRFPTAINEGKIAKTSAPLEQLISRMPSTLRDYIAKA